ncbi:MAG: hypothetical protein BWY71_01447 [Planctomycetes bacterium ADurb.Bin412]|nr:MAG: hypothetical protein BWY71_01447 [Planctomycetes bacterium ADurb.Bin412]
MRGLLECDPVDRLVGWIQNPDCQVIGLARPDGFSDIQYKHVFAPLMAADRNTVYPDLGQIVNHP